MILGRLLFSYILLYRNTAAIDGRKRFDYVSIYNNIASTANSAVLNQLEQD